MLKTIELYTDPASNLRTENGGELFSCHLLLYFAGRPRFHKINTKFLLTTSDEPWMEKMTTIRIKKLAPDLVYYLDEQNVRHSLYLTLREFIAPFLPFNETKTLHYKIEPI